MSVRKAIKESFIINLLIVIKDLTTNSLLFNMQNSTNVKTIKSTGGYRPWNKSSLIYSFFIKADRLLNILEKRILNIINDSRIINGARVYKNKFSNHIKTSSVLNNSKIFVCLKRIKNNVEFGDILAILATGYIFLDAIIRKVGFLTRFGSIWDELLLITLVLYIIFKRISSGGDIHYNFTPMGLPTIIFIFIGITHGMMLSPDASITIEGFRAVFQQVLWYFPITQLIRDRKGAHRIMNTMLIMGLLMGVHAAYQYLTRVPMPGNWVDVTENIRTRAFSIVGSPNILGSLFVLFIPIGIVQLIINRDKKSGIFYLLSVLFMILGLLFTLSRGAWLAFAFSMFIFIIVINVRLILPFTVLGGLFVLSGSSISQRLLFMLSPSYMIKSAAGGRLYRWEIGIDIWRRNKLLGVGLGRYGGAVAINNQLAPFYLDNYYLKTMTEMGLYGLSGLAFIIICFTLFTAKIIKYQEHMESRLIAIGLFAGAVGVLVQNFVENIFEVPAMFIYFWIAIALINTFAPKFEPK